MRNRLLVLLATAAIVVGACGTSATPVPSSAPPVSSPPASETPSAPASPAGIDITTTNYKPEAVGHTGGKLILAEWQPAEDLWPYFDNSATVFEATGIAMWSLWNVTADFKYYGQLATNVPTVANGGVVVNGAGMDLTVNLVPGAQWSDGQPITCQDLIDNWHWQMDPGQVGNVQGHFGWEDIKSIDGGTGSDCIVHFSKVFEGYLGLWAPLLPGHYIKTVPVADAFNKLYPVDKIETGVYSGPYRPVKLTLDTQTEYVPNEKFWSTIKKATAPFDGVTFKYYESSDAEIAGFRNNPPEFDLGMNLNHTDLAKLTAVDPAQVDSISGLTYEQNSLNNADFIKKFGAADAPTILQAVKLAYDKDAITQRIIGGSAPPSCNFAAPEAWFYSDIPCPTPDVAKANSLLDAAGWTLGSDGIRAKGGTKLDLLACTSATRTYRVDTLTLVASQLQQIGIKVTVSPVKSTILFAGWNSPADTPCDLTHGNFDIAEFAWVASPDPLGIYLLYNSAYDPSKGDHSGANYIRVNNPELDKLLDDAKTSVDLQHVKDVMAQVQALYVKPENAFPEVALYNWKTVAVKSPNLHNFVNNSTAATQIWNIEDWWMAQ